MKTKLLSILAVAILVFSANAQIPTTGLVGHYDFNNGALTDNINSVSFTKTGTASTNITDRFGNANGAISLNGDDLTRSDIDFNLSNSSQYLTQSISFWVKTATNDANKRIIYSDNDQTSTADTSFDGMSVHIKDGQISAAFRDNIHSGNYFTHSTIVSDNSWHHVVVQASVTNTSGTRRIITYVYIDAVKEGGTALVTRGMDNTDPNHVGNVSFSRLKSATLSNTQKYLDGLDEVLFYTRLLTDTEVNLIATDASCNVNIPDANFKANLLANTAINTNGDVEIQCSEASAYTGVISVPSQNIQSLTGIEAFTEITGLQAFNNNLTTVNLSQNTKITQLLLEGNSNLTGSLDLSAMTALTDFKAHTTLIESINVANGNNTNFSRFECYSNTSLTCVQIDAGFSITAVWSVDNNAVFSENCYVLSTLSFEINEAKVSLYPNPTTSVLNIKMDSNLKRATIYSVLGTKVLETSSKNITTSNLNKGIYLLKIETDNGNISTKRFIKQ
jgi:hypothetical protein